MPLFKTHIDGIGNSQIGDNSYTIFSSNISLGKGTNIIAAYNYPIKDNFGLQMGFSYFFAAKVEMSEQAEVGSLVKTVSRELHCSYFSFNPGLFFSYPLGSIIPFLNVGFSVGKGKIFLDETVDSWTSKTQLKWSYSGGFFIGQYTGIGMEIVLSEKTHLFTEVKLNNIYYKPSQGKLTEAKENDEDILDTYTISQKEIDFVDSYTIDYGPKPDENAPSKEVFENYSCGNILFSIGVRFSVE